MFSITWRAAHRAAHARSPNRVDGRRALARIAHLTPAFGALLAFAAGPGAAARAQAPSAPASSDTGALVLGSVYRDTRRESPRIVAAHALARAAKARVPSASLPPDPQLQFGFMNYTIPGLRPMDPTGMTQLSLMQMVPIPGKLRLAGRTSASRARAEGERATDIEWEVRAQAAMMFYTLYQTDQSLAVARETFRLLQDIQRTAEAMYRVGEGRQADVLRAQVEIARMVEDTVRMTTMRTGMAAQLNALLDRPANAAVDSPALPAFPGSVPPLESLVELAEAGRPMLKAGEQEVEAADAQASLARREIWPDLTVGVQYGQRGGAMGAERMGSLMVGASVPIFAGKRQLRMREEAAAMRQMAAAELTAMRADTRSRVTEAYASLVRARKLTSLYRTTILPQTEAAVTSALAAYRVGTVDFMTLLDNRMTVNKYRQELFALQAEEGKAWADLEMLLGRELFDANTVAGIAATAGGGK